MAQLVRNKCTRSIIICFFSEAYTFMKGEPDIISLYESRFAESLSRLKDLAEARENADAYREGLPERPRT